MKWEICYYSEAVQAELMELPAGLQARYLRLADRLELHGPNLGMPHTKMLRDGLFELRLKSKEGIGRVFCCAVIGCRIVILHSFVKKTQKTPANELNVALKRMKEVKDHADS